MNPNSVNKIKGFLEGKKIKVEKNIFIFLVFVVIATIFWFLNALSKEYVTDIEYPVTYKNLPKNKVLLEKLPDHFILKINAYGFTILKYTFTTTEIPIEIDVNSYNLRKVPDGKPWDYFILTQHVKEKIASQIERGIAIVDIKPDSLIFKFAPVISKKVKIVSAIHYQLAKQYILSDEIIVAPDSLLISGPFPVVDTIDHVETQYLDAGVLDKTISKSIALKHYGKAEYSVKKVQVTFPVEQFTEATLNIPVEAINVPDSMLLKTMPREVGISYLIGISRFNKISADDFRAVVDFSSIRDNLSNNLTIIMEKSPTFIHSLRMNPKSVEFYLEKK